MCEVLNVIEARGRMEGRLEGHREGCLEGRREGRFEVLCELVKDGILSLTEAARRVNLSENEFAKKFEEYKMNSQTR